MSFCAAVNCMDGRVQLPVMRHLRDRFGVEYVDTITEPGPVQYLASDTESHEVVSIRRRVEISLSAHGSTVIAVAAHAFCAGNPISDDEQRRQIEEAAAYLARTYPAATVVGLWVAGDWSVHPVCEFAPTSD